MSFIAAAAVTGSKLTIKRARQRIFELALLGGMKLQYDMSDEYTARNGHTCLVDLTIKPSQLIAPRTSCTPCRSRYQHGQPAFFSV